ncbi:O-antigen ligase family protein [Candidatus Bipolaricaulota bacterium]|nr:O-antigen ligase family protein [Candidatus Bipolaricaulota bacterium]
MKQRSSKNGRGRTFPSIRALAGGGVDAVARRGLVALLALSAGVVPVVFSNASTTYAEAKFTAALTCVGVLWVWMSAASIRNAALAVRVPCPAWGLAGFLVAILVSGVAAVVSGIWWEGLIGFVALASVVLLAASIPRSRLDVRAVIWGLTAAGTLTAVYALLQAFGVAANAEAASMVSVMGNPNLVGGFLVILLPAALSVVWFARSVPHRLAALAMVTVQLAALANLDHTGGVVALSVALLFVAVAALVSGGARAIFRRDGWSILAVSLIAAGVLAAAYFGPMQAILHRDREAAATTGVAALWEANSGTVRETFWRAALSMTAERPWNGVGLGHYQIEYLDALAALKAIDPSITVPPRPTTHAHNDYLQIVAETGIPGLVAIVAVLVLLAVYGIGRIRSAGDGDQRMEVLFLLGSVVAYLILAAVSFPTYSISSIWPAAILLGLAGSPAYGERGVCTLRVRGKLRWAFLIGSVALATLVGVVAWRGFDGDVLLHRGRLQLNGGFATASETTLTRSIAVDPNPREAYYFRSIARILQAEQAQNSGDTARATELYEAAAADLRACETRFPRPEVYLTEANLGFIGDDRAMSEAAIDLLVAIGQPTDVYVQALYLQAHLAREDRLLEDARSILLQITVIDPDYNRAYVALGDLLVAEGDLDGARRQYELALSRAQSKLSDTERRLASTDARPASESGGLQETATEARQEIRFAVEALGRLPSLAPSPIP